MIFKTFDSDIDKISAKWGVFGKSFYDFAEASRNRKIAIDDLFTLGGVPLKDAKKQAGSFWSYLYPKKEDIQKQLIDVDSIIPKIDSDNFDFDNWINELNEVDKKVKAGTISWQDYSNSLDNNQKWIAKWGQETQGTIRTQEGLIKANQSARDAAIAHNTALKQQTLSAKAGQVALKGLAMAGNMLATMAITWAVSKIVKGINDLAHAAENARKASAELTDSYKQEKQAIDDSISKYKELSEKLKDTSLSTSEVKSLKEELLSVQDDLNEKYGAEATQIDLVNGKYDEEIKKLNTLAKKKAQDFIATNYNNNKEDQKYVKDAITLRNTLATYWYTDNNDSISSMTNPAGINLPSVTLSKNSIDYNQAFGFDIQKYIDKYNDLILSVNKNTGAIELVTSGTREEIYNQLTQLFNDLSNDFGESNESVNNFKSTLNNIINDSFDTEEIENTKKRIKEYAEAEILSGDESSKAYNDLITAVENYNEALSSGKGVDEAEAKLLEAKNSVEDTSKDITNAGDVFQDVYNSISDSAPVEIKVKFAIDGTDETLQQQYDDVIQQAKDKFTEEPDFDWDSWFKENSINTQEEIDKWNDIAQSANNAAEARKKYTEGDISSTPNSTFEDAWEDLKASTNDNIKDLDENLLKLAESGRLTVETFNEADSTGYFKNFDISAEEAITKINALVDSATQLKSMSDQVSKMADLLADKKNGTTASASDFTGFDDTVKGMDSWEEYKTVMGDTNSTLEECQRVSNALATEWANSGEFLSQLTDETKDFYVTQLSLMGVENAQEVVESRLAQKKVELQIAQDYATVAQEYNNDAKNRGKEITENYLDATSAELDALVAEGGTCQETANSIANYAVKKEMANGATLDTSADIQNLAKLAGVTTEVGRLLNELAIVKTQALQPSMGLSPEAAQDQIDKIKAHIDELVNGGQAKYELKLPTDLDLNDNGSDGYKNSSSSSEKSKQKFDWIETLLSRIERKIKNLGNTVSATWKSWSTRNDALAKELSSITDEINAQQKAYDTYMSYANGVGLSDYYKQLVQSGDYKIEEIGDDTLKEQIELYKEYYEKALDCADAVDTLQNNLADLAKTKFDNVGKQFDEQLQSITHSIDMTEATIDNIETKAYIVSGDYYNKLINLQKQNIAGLQEKYVGLQNAMNEAINSGNIAKYSEEWYELQDSVNSAEKAVIDADKALLEYENDLRQLNWDIFDKTEDYISKVQEESNFLIDLMSNSKLFNDTGKATDNGMASLGLHAVNLNAYMSQADDYAKEIQRISKDIADDPYNVTLIERRQELIKSQQDMIKNAEEEKQAIKSLISDGYNTMLDALNKLIDKRKEFLNVQKDAYDYQKNIQEQTKEIANYQKQLQALQGDMSEETRSKVQQIKVSLEEAQTKLQETEYDKWVSDTEQMLDMLSSETESWINERLDNLDGLITEVIDTTNANADNIQTTLQQVGEDVGYSLTPEMDKIWETNDGLNNVVTQYTNSFETHMTTVQDTLNGIKDLIQQMSGGSTNGAGSGVDGANNAPSNGNTGATTTPNTSPTTSNPKTNNSGGDGKANVGDSVIFDNGVYHEDEYGNGRSGAYKLGQTVYITKINPNSQYPYHISQTNKLHEHDLGWVRLDQLRGYAKGSRYIKDDQLAFTQENGGEIIYRAKDGAILTPLNSGDMVFTAEMSNRLWEMAKGNMNVPSIASSVPKFVANTNNGVTTGDTNVSLTLNLPNVTNYNEFKQALLNDNSFSKAMADKTIGVSLGKNSLLYKTR